MRLTNITRVTLPVGRLRHYAPREGAITVDPLPISFDQRRHVSEGDRPGSWMALAMRLPHRVDAARLGDAWLAVVRRHGTMRTVFDRDEHGALRLREHVMLPGRWVERPTAPGRPMRDAVRAVLDATCRPFARPSHRLVLIEPPADAADPRPVVVIASDHSHVDMWSVMVLGRDLLDALQALEAGVQPFADLPPAADFAGHTAELAVRPPADPAIRDRWHAVLGAEGGLMPRLHVDLGDVSRPRDEVVEVRDIVDATAVARLEAVAADAGVRLLPLVLSVIAGVTRAQTGLPLRAVLPVHSRYDARWHDAVGWFITNSVLECSDDTPAGCAAAMREALRLGSTPLAPILGPGGMPATPRMLAISWLDTRRLPVRIDPALQPQYVSASLPVADVMVWFVVSEAGMHLRCRYPDTPAARRSVRGWLDGIVAGVRTLTAPSRGTPAVAGSSAR